jgi:hypothetical protein
MSQSWEILVAVALLGTDRQKTLPAIAEENIKTLLDQVDSSDAELWLLSATGTLAAYQQAGQTSEKRTEPLPEPAEAEVPTPEEPAFLPFLRMIFTQGFQPALPEFLSLLQQSQQCIPPEFLPQLLDWGYSHPEVRLHLLPVIGKRGEWLARLNPKWRYAQATPQSSNPDEWKELWETSDRMVRINLLREWRSQDSSAARELVETTWKQDAAKDRAAFLECFSVGLTLADEGFLEKGLGDRSKEVRAVAIDLLTRLPDSQFSQQIEIQASASIQFTIVEGKLQVEITLPQTDDPRWKNYNFKDQTIAQWNLKQGDRANLLIQILGITPLSNWEKADSPEQLVHSVINHEWELSIIQGWSLACQQQSNSNWVHALLGWFKQQSSSQLHHMGAVELVAQLLSLLPVESRCQWIATWLDPPCWDHQIELLLKTLPAPWSLDVSQLLLRSVQKYLETFEGESDKEFARRKRYIAYNHLPSMADCLHPDSLDTPEIAQLRLLHVSDQAFNLDKVLKILQFRQQMYQVF